VQAVAGSARYHIGIDPIRPAEFPVSSSLPPIVIYSTAICPYCVAAKNFLKSQGREWTEVRVDLDPAEREKMVNLARRTSVPQIFVGDVHVGGYDDMMALHRAGGLLPLLDGRAPEGSA
jgi:glutaredoxin 3